MSKEEYEKEMQSNNIGGRIWAKSTESSRTMISAQALLSEFIPNAKNVTLNIAPRYLEMLTPNAHPCRRLKGYVEKMKSSHQYKQKVKETSQNFKTLKELLGTEKSELTFERYFDTIQGRRCWNKPMPCSKDGSKCIDSSFADTIIEMGNWDRAYQYNIRGWDGAIELAKMRVGPILIEFLTNMLHRIQSVDDHRFLLYSAHDSTISAILGVLVDKPLHWPGYASNFIIELWKSTEENIENQYFFRVIYNGSPIKMAWCNDNSQEILHHSNIHSNKTDTDAELNEELNNYKRFENTIDYEDKSCNTLENLKNYLQDTLNLSIDLELDYNNKSTSTPSLIYDVDQECNRD